MRDFRMDRRDDFLSCISALRDVKEEDSGVALEAYVAVNAWDNPEIVMQLHLLLFLQTDANVLCCCIQCLV